MNKGFSLIELLFVIAIVGILSAIAYPSYCDYLTRTRRLDGQTALLHLASRLEDYYTRENTYQTATLAEGKTSDILSTPTSTGGWYTLTITHITATTYQLQATPIGPQASRDTRCQSLTLSSTGIEGVTTGPAGSPTELARRCW